jgi:hypothetical protein
VMPHRGEGGDMVLFGQCHTVGWGAKEARDDITAAAEREKGRGSGAQHGPTMRRGRGGGSSSVTWQ